MWILRMDEKGKDKREQWSWHEWVYRGLQIDRQYPPRRHCGTGNNLHEHNNKSNCKTGWQGHLALVPKSLTAKLLAQFMEKDVRANTEQF
jgi:hypothetical protein